MIDAICCLSTIGVTLRCLSRVARENWLKDRPANYAMRIVLYPSPRGLLYARSNGKIKQTCLAVVQDFLINLNKFQKKDEYYLYN